MRKRIAIIVEYFPPRLGGDRRIFELMTRLSSKYDIHFLILPPSYTLFIRKIEKYVSGTESTFVHERMTGHHLSIPQWILNLWDNGFVQPFSLTMSYLALKLTAKLAALKPDVVIISHASVYVGLLGFISSKFARKKLLVEYNDLQALYTFELVKAKIPPKAHTIVKDLLMAQEDIIVKNGWRVTAITDFIKNYASSRRTRFDIDVIPDGVDCQAFDPTKFDRNEMRDKYGVSKNEKLCLYAGRLEIVAGSGILLETAKLLENTTSIRFMIVGEGNRDLVNQFKARQNVIYVGPVSKEQVPKYLSAADIVFVPFAKGIASHSISPLKLFEALSMEKAVIASKISGIEEVVKDNFYGALVSDDPCEWASAINKVANSENSIMAGKRNREIVLKKYDWAFLADQFSKVIEGKA
jgi:glycosyltransferase involved in cell wall biosynthesis